MSPVPQDRKKPPATVPEEKRAAEYLANERTFLAWIRTSIAVISLGFVVARFGLFLQELAEHLGKPTPFYSSSRVSGLMGIALMTLGGVLPVLAAWRYHVVNRAIERDQVRPDRGLVVLITGVATVLATALVIYMLRAL